LIGGAGAPLQLQCRALGLCALWGYASYYKKCSELPVGGGPGILGLELERCDSPVRRCSVKHWASVYPWGTGLLVLHSEQEVIAFLPLVGNLAFSLFDRGSKGSLAVRDSGEFWASKLWEGKPTEWQGLESGVHLVCGGRLLALCSRLRVTMRQRGQRV
jgi:hypothetical protein